MALSFRQGSIGAFLKILKNRFIFNIWSTEQDGADLEMALMFAHSFMSTARKNFEIDCSVQKLGKSKKMPFLLVFVEKRQHSSKKNFENRLLRSKVMRGQKWRFYRKKVKKRLKTSFFDSS